MYLFLVIMHLAGTVLGVGGATMIEVHLHRALKDGTVSDDEKNLLQTDYAVVRVGLILALLSGFGFLLLYKFTGETERLFSPILWTKILIIIFIAANTLLLQARKIPLFWGAGISFVSWWTAAILGVFSTNRAPIDFFGQGTFISSFISITALYVVLVIVGSMVLELIRKRVK